MAATDTAVRFSIDVATSRFTVRAFATGLFSSLGHSPVFAVRDYSGEAAFDAENPEQSSIRISVQAASLVVTDNVSQKDRDEIENKTNQEVLETSRYPEIVFESSQVAMNKLGNDRYAATITGNLTLHGVTRSETITAQVMPTGDRLRAYGDFSLKQTNYGIQIVSVAGGTLKVKDEVKVIFDFSARRQ
jgi:polyisoprenoid-binding protein YceI